MSKPDEHPSVARGLPSPPEDQGMAEMGLCNSIALRLAQLVAFVRLQGIDRLALDALNTATNPHRRREVPARGVVSAEERELALRQWGAVLAHRIAHSIGTYVDQYDADDAGASVREDARILLESLVLNLAASLRIGPAAGGDAVLLREGSPGSGRYG